MRELPFRPILFKTKTRKINVDEKEDYNTLRSKLFRTIDPEEQKLIEEDLLRIRVGPEDLNEKNFGTLFKKIGTEGSRYNLTIEPEVRASKIHLLSGEK